MRQKELELEYWVQFIHTNDDRETAWMGPFGYVRMSFSEIQVSTPTDWSKTLATYTHVGPNSQLTHPEWLADDGNFYQSAMIVAKAAGTGAPR